MSWVILTLSIHSGMFALHGEYSSLESCEQFKRKFNNIEWEAQIKHCVPVDKNELRKYVFNPTSR